MFNNCIGLRELNIGGMDINNVSYNYDCFARVGTAESPCRLIVGSVFDKSVLGCPYTNESGVTYYRWLDGYFTDPIIDDSYTGIFIPSIQQTADGVVYNLSGQRVRQGYRGISIQKGKKWIRK